MKDWYDGNQHELIRIAVASGGFQVDYDPSRGMYRVSVFDELGHWQDECWFDEYRSEPAKFNGVFYVGKKKENAPPEPTISAEKMREMCENAQKFLRNNGFWGTYTPEKQIVFCKNCRHRGTTGCPMYSEEWYEIDEGGGYYDSDFMIHDRTIDDGFCDRGERGNPYE